MDKTVATYLTQRIAMCGKSQIEIAREAGFARPNVITMLKKGLTRVPLARVPALAKAIGADPGDLMTRCLGEYQPDFLRALCDAYGIVTGVCEESGAHP